MHGSGATASRRSGFHDLPHAVIPASGQAVNRVDAVNTRDPANDNFSQAELDKFGALAQRWWDPEGPQKALHALNPARLGYVEGRVKLQGATVLDVGCGAGLLSEALARNGAEVTALDLAPELIKVARLHRLESGISVDYRLQSAESLAQEMPGHFDAITCMEMLEHVPDPAAIVSAVSPSTLSRPFNWISNSMSLVSIS